MKRPLPLVLLILMLCLSAAAQQATVHPEKVDPSWLHQYVPSIPFKAVDLTTPTCHYKPIFGVGDSEAQLPVTLARYGEVTVDSHGECKTVSYPREEQIYVILGGSGILHYGNETAPVRKDDFMYFPPALAHTVTASSGEALRLVVMGFKIPDDIQIDATAKFPGIVNLENVKEQVLTWHGPTVRYKLLLGPRDGTRNAINAANVVQTLFLMDFAPGGTNFPHHHEYMEEMYLLMDGQGEEVAGGGTNGVEGLHPAKAGDAYFYRQNCTVGFYNGKDGRADILAVQSRLPLPKHPY
jgi:mannose-6-phosphate isomerase-like protein (cupin superfamily)